LSVATLHKIRGVLHAALNGAIRRGLIERNPAHWVELPRARRPKAVVWTEARVAHWQATGERPRVAVWTSEQTATFLDATRGYELFALYLLVALVGLRRGEASGLRWCDLDLDHGSLMVSHQVQDHNGRTVICPPKTQTSVRTVALPRVAVTVLRRLYDRQRCGSGGMPTGFVFARSRGVPFSPGYLTHTFRLLAARAGVPPIRLHDLRHGAASLMLAAAVS
jgi:integrase